MNRHTHYEVGRADGLFAFVLSKENPESEVQTRPARVLFAVLRIAKCTRAGCATQKWSTYPNLSWYSVNNQDLMRSWRDIAMQHAQLNHMIAVTPQRFQILPTIAAVRTAQYLRGARNGQIKRLTG